MGWLRLVGSLKLQVCFAKEPYKRDYILPKRPRILRSPLIVATPYIESGKLLGSSHGGVKKTRIVAYRVRARGEGLPKMSKSKRQRERRHTRGQARKNERMKERGDERERRTHE